MLIYTNKKKKVPLDKQCYLVRTVLLTSLLSETDGRHGSQFHPGLPAGLR